MNSHQQVKLRLQIRAATFGSTHLFLHTNVVFPSFFLHAYIQTRSLSLSLPPSYMNYLDQYEDFLLKNASQITGIEASLRSLTYILPGNQPSPYNIPHPAVQTV